MKKDNFTLDDALEDRIIQIHVKKMHNLNTKLCESDTNWQFKRLLWNKKKIKKKNTEQAGVEPGAASVIGEHVTAVSEPELVNSRDEIKKKPWTIAIG